MTQSYLRNRYYDPSIGRFISEDPIKDGLNWYVYCENDPVNAVDPIGLSGKNYYIVVFAGINTNKGSFDHVTPEIARQLLDEDSTAKVNYKTIIHMMILFLVMHGMILSKLPKMLIN